MRVHFCDHHVVTLPEGHRFPMEKYRMLRERLVAEAVLHPDELSPADAVDLDAVRAVHDDGYVDAVLEGTLPRDAVRRLGFPWSPALVARTLASVGGTVKAAWAALDDGCSGNLAGGTHHAHHDFGSGFCVFNDVVVAARTLLDAGAVERVLVFDVDVHQGDGTAALCGDESRVFTTSLHGAKNFPARKTRSDLDVALDDGTGDEAYLAAMGAALDQSLERSRADLCFVQGGVDVLADDHLGRLSLTHAGLEARDRELLGRLRAEGIPAVLTLGGGYSRPIDASLRGHVGTYRVAKSLFP